MGFIGFIASSPIATAQDKQPAFRTGGLETIEPGTQISTRTLIVHPRASRNVPSSRLFPPANERKRGSAAPIFLRMNWEANTAMKALDELYAKDFPSKPLEELDVDEIERLKVIRKSEMRRAVYRQRANWEYPIDEEPAIGILLPDVQQGRQYARAMSTYARAAIIRNNHAEAEEWIRLTIGFAKHVGETPFAVVRMVQISETNDALLAFEELIQHPEADNYFWDLSSLPRPMVQVHDSIQFENSIIKETFPELADLNEVRSEDEWFELAFRVFGMLAEYGSGGKDTPRPGTPEAVEYIQHWVEISRASLPKVAPELADKMKSMSDAEVGLRYWWLRVQAAGQQMALPAMLETHLAIPMTMAAEDKVRNDLSDEKIVAQSLFTSIPWLLAAAAAVDQRIAMLRIVESMRDYASTHNNHLPKSLVELSLPAPKDVLSDSSFEWHVAEDRKSGMLSSSIVEGKVPFESGSRRRGRRYRIELSSP